MACANSSLGFVLFLERHVDVLALMLGNAILQVLVVQHRGHFSACISTVGVDIGWLHGQFLFLLLHLLEGQQVFMDFLGVG